MGGTEAEGFKRKGDGPCVVPSSPHGYEIMKCLGERLFQEGPRRMTCKDSGRARFLNDSESCTMNTRAAHIDSVYQGLDSAQRALNEIQRVKKKRTARSPALRPLSVSVTVTASIIMNIPASAHLFLPTTPHCCHPQVTYRKLSVDRLGNKPRCTQL